MKNILVFLFFVFPLTAQVHSPDIKIHTKENIRLFADYLFCEGDYLRSSFEYEKLSLLNNDTLTFKNGLSLKRSGILDEAQKKFSLLNNTSGLYEYSRLESFSIYYLQKNFHSLDNEYSSLKKSSIKIEVERIFTYSFLLRESIPFDEDTFISFFEMDDKEAISGFYNRKKFPGYKSPLLAGILSGLLPGIGKIYTEEYTDGLFAALLTGVLAYLSYDNFKAGHKFRGWLFGGLGAFFYAGNIYGAAASAQLFNAKIDFNFNLDVESFIRKKNYFLPEYEFLCP